MSDGDKQVDFLITHTQKSINQSMSDLHHAIQDSIK